MKNNQKPDIIPDKERMPEPSPEVFELLDTFIANLKPADIGNFTKNYTTAEIIVAIREFNADLKISDSMVAHYLKQHGFHYEVLPDQYSLKFQWLFAEK